MSIKSIFDAVGQKCHATANAIMTCYHDGLHAAQDIFLNMKTGFESTDGLSRRTKYGLESVLVMETGIGVAGLVTLNPIMVAEAAPAIIGTLIPFEEAGQTIRHTDEVRSHSHAYSPGAPTA